MRMMGKSSGFRKPLFWIILLTLLFSLAYYINQNFLGLGPFPERSAFNGRLPSTLEGDRRRFQFFYTTNRENNDETFIKQNSRFGEGLIQGTFDVLITPGLSIRPFVWFEEESMKWGGREELNVDAFQKSVKESVQASPDKSILVIVWGFRDWFRSAALKTAYTAYALDINTPVILFDWPGNPGEGPGGYRAAQEASAKSAPMLGEFLLKLSKDSGAEHIWIMGSSLGCQTICDSLAWIYNQPVPNKPKFDHIVLSAPDVSLTTFDDKFADIIRTLSNHFTAYVSSNDQALLTSHWINREKRLGRTAVATPHEFEEAYALLDLQAKGALNISIVDATPINRLRNLHHFFTDSAEFFDDLYQRLLKPDEIISRRLHPIRTEEGSTYWILWNY